MYHAWPELEHCIRPAELLAARTTFRVGGPARWFARPRDVQQLSLLVRRCRQEGIDLYVLGRGANLLVSDDGVDGMVIHLDGPDFRRVEWSSDRSGTSGAGEAVEVCVGGGVDMPRLVRGAVRRGLAGLEGLAGVPGTVGGCLRMNAGGAWGQIADVVVEVTVVDRDGQVRRRRRDEIRFGYRTSDLDGVIVCDAKLVLHRTDPVALRRRFSSIRERKKKTQPMHQASAGCVFKNPPGARAGVLVDRAGLKGVSVGGARVSELHGNFIVTRRGATAADVWALIEQVRQRVADLFGIVLELEIETWGFVSRPVGVC